MSVVLVNDVCSRCGKEAAELYPYKLSEVVYRGKKIEFPWLCVKCLKAEKKKAWK